MRARLGWGLVLAAALACGSPEAPAQERFVFGSYQELESFYDEMGYSFENWRAGMREIPRCYPVEVPVRWSEVADTVTVDHKKRLFFRALLPLVLRANELVLEDRTRALSILESTPADDPLEDEDGRWLRELAVRYGVLDSESDALDADARKTLLRRVDAVPASLALGQAAYESGYATSRFAGLGNALYGQWSYGKGIKPSQQRASKGDHRIAAFDTPLQSIQAYVMNLNRHAAYQDFRRRRAELRRAETSPTGLLLADALGRYSERGADYVKTLKQIIRSNRLEQAEEAELIEMEPIWLVPRTRRDGSEESG